VADRQRFLKRQKVYNLSNARTREVSKNGNPTQNQAFANINNNTVTMNETNA